MTLIELDGVARRLTILPPDTAAGHLGELIARIRAMLRRSQYGPPSPSHLRFGVIDVDFAKFEVRRQGKRIELTRKEFAMLKLLARMRYRA